MITCTHCSRQFTITSRDQEFFERIAPKIGEQTFAIPEPTLCPTCRYQRRLAFRNERALYHRKCDLSGRPMISMHPANTVFPVYHITEWMSDKWDPKEFAQEFDFSRPFFEQFKEFCDRIPHFSAFIDPHMDINSEYTNCSSEAKNCYMISQAERNEDCYYSRGINSCKSCCDCFRVHKCELCYECIDLNGCYKCLYCQDCDNSTDCYFSTDLRGCKYCFGCHGLSQKEYHIFNTPVSKEEWEERVESLVLTQKIIEHMRQQSATIRLTVPQRAARQIQCEDCTGDHITNCRDCKEVFDSNYMEYCTYCNEIASGAKYCQDYCMWGIDCELLYECNGCGYNVYHSLFCNHCWQNCSNLLYCESCFPGVKDCFGCFGLRQDQYCIFNKQYTKEEYEELVPKIIHHMKSTGEWGEFFPISISPYAYNEALCGQFFPLEKEDVLAHGWTWRDDEEAGDQYMGPNFEIPDTIADVSDDVTEHILRCEATDKPYRITQQELQFYKQLGLPLPRLCPQQRHKERGELRNPRTLWQRKCAKCSVQTDATFAPDRPEIIYCESCYLDHVS